MAEANLQDQGLEGMLFVRFRIDADWAERSPVPLLLDFCLSANVGILVSFSTARWEANYEPAESVQLIAVN